MRTSLLSLMLALLPSLALAQGLAPPPAAPTRLADLVSQLESANPDLSAARCEVDASVARIRPAGAPPDPTISAGYMSGFLRPPFYPSADTPEGRWQFGMTQELPYPGKLAIRTRIASTAADRARWAVEARRVQLVAELKSAYVELVRVDRTQAVLDRTRQVLGQAREAAGARFRVGRGPQQDVLRAQLEISLLIERVTVLHRERAMVLGAANALLARPADTPLASTLAFEVAPPEHRLDELQALAQERNPLVERDARQIDTAQQGLALARTAVLPDFGVNVVTQRRVGDMPWMYGVDVMVKVPLFW
ncbi:MAG: TolC family protein, partial [Acidobacteriota bacterium]